MPENHDITNDERQYLTSNIRRLLRYKKRTIKEMADALDVPDSTVRRWLKDPSDLSFSYIERIAAYLSVWIHELFTSLYRKPYAIFPVPSKDEKENESTVKILRCDYFMERIPKEITIVMAYSSREVMADIQRFMDKDYPDVTVNFK